MKVPYHKETQELANNGFLFWENKQKEPPPHNTPRQTKSLQPWNSNFEKS